MREESKLEAGCTLSSQTHFHSECHAVTRGMFLSCSDDSIHKMFGSVCHHTQIKSILTGSSDNGGKKIHTFHSNWEQNSPKCHSNNKQCTVIHGGLFWVVPRDAFYAVSFWNAATWVLFAAVLESTPICLNPAFAILSWMSAYPCK